MTYPQSQPPYFDDYDETKNFQSILFKPAVAVQTRELNQMQTIQQSQIQRFGDSIYTSGSIVTGGKTTINNKVMSAKLLPTYGGAGINVTPLVNLYAKGETSGLIGLIVMTVVATTTNPNTLIYMIRNGGNNSGLFIDNELIQIFTDQACTIPFNVTVQSATGTVNSTTITTCNANSDTIVVASATGINIGDRVIASTINGVYVNGISGNIISLTAQVNYNIAPGTAVTFSTDNSQPTTLVSISNGVYYVDGYFLEVQSQTIILDLYDRSSSFIVGLSHDVVIVTSETDSTLLDNASGSYNYAAPGADRLQIPLILTKIPLTGDSPSNLVSSGFFEILRISNGVIQSQTNLPIYSELNQTMARRTYDEAGNFIVKPFKLNLENDGLVSTMLLAEMSAGKAYVRGNEIKTISTTDLKVNRALSTQSLTGFDISSFYGAYVIVTAPTKSIPQFGTALSVEIHNVASGQSGATKIGTANVRYMSYNSGSGTSVLYNAYIFNIVLSGTNVFTSALSFITTATAGVYSTITTSLVVASAGIVSGKTILFNSGFNSLLFPIPQTFISTVPLVEYTTKRVFKGVLFSSGVATINGNNQYEQFLGGSGIIPGAVAIQYFAVTCTSTSGTFTSGTFIPLDTNSRVTTIPVVGAGIAGQAIINVNDSTFNGTCDIVASLQLSNDVRRTKTLVSNLNVNIAVPSSTALMSLGVSDIFSIAGIYDSGNLSIAATTSSTNVTANYLLDNGQRDTHYDFGNISLIAGKTAPVGQLLVVVNYFTHSGGTGYLTVDSYAIPYGTIPTYTNSIGVVNQLRDCLDFRPRRIDGSSTLTFPQFQIPDPTYVMISESYYLSRIDKIVMTSAGSFKVLSGIPAYTNPQPPADLPDAMTLYTLVLPAYTINANAVTVIAANNRRYTMNDIAALDSRLSNVEAYTALNMLEQAVTNTTLTNPSGATLYQNGFLVEPFVDFTVGDVGNADFKCSIDTVNSLSRAPFTSTNLPMVWNATGSTSQKTGNLVTSPYSQIPFVVQNLATKYVNINPYNVFSNVGQLSLSPTTDIWYDVTQVPAISTSPAAATAMTIAQSNAIANGQSAIYGDWTQWLTPPASSTNTFGLANGGTETEVTTYTVSSSSAVLSQTTEQYMRSVPVNYSVTGLTPLDTIFVYLDGVNISSYVTPGGASQNPTGVTGYTTVSSGSGYTSNSTITVSITGGAGTGALPNIIINPNGGLSLVAAQFGSGYTTMPTVTVTATGGGSGAVFTANNNNTIGMPIVTDVNGNASGVITIPDDANNRFVCGVKTIIFSDNMDSVMNSMSFASATFTSQGYVDVDQTTVSTQASITTIVTPPPPPPAVVPVSNPVIPVFCDAPYTYAQYVTAVQTNVPTGLTGNFYGTGPLSLVTIQNICTAIIAAYHASPVACANISRTVVNSSGTVLATGLPDWNDAVRIALQTVQAGQSPAWGAALVTSGLNGNSYNEIHSLGISALTGPTVLDPLAESFFVDATMHPQGIFLSSVDLFFASKDTVSPAYVELRTMDNGYPTTTVIPFSQVTLMPSAVNTSTLGTVATNCVFPSPVYLAPGQYSLVIKSDSNNYNMFVAEFGKVLLSGTATVTKQPYMGAFFESQNGSTWTADQTLSLCFVLYNCNFALGTSTFNLNSVAGTSEFDYDLINLTSQELNFNGVTGLSTSIASTPIGGSLSSFSQFSQNVDFNFSTRQKVLTNNDLMVNYAITTQSHDVSPVVDLTRSSAILVQNIINQSPWTIPETTCFGGGASAKYVSKKVTLATGMNADNLIIYLNVNRSASTSIQVYYKVQNQFDTTSFVTAPWVLMNQELNGGYTSQNGASVEDKWSSYAISYVNSGTTYTNFNSFQIKIVMQSSNPSYSPSIYDIREIATA